MFKNRFNLRNVAAIAVCLAGMTLFSGCDETENVPGIKPENEAALTQTAFADETDVKSDVTFVTAGAWTSSVTEGAAPKSAGMATGSVKAGTGSWLGITPDHGDAAGRYTIVITLEPNYTGSDRTATITVLCGDSEITITITQRAMKEDGTVPDPTVTGITLSADALMLAPGDTVYLRASVQPDAAAGRSIEWDSSNEEVAVVSGTGNVAVAEIIAVNRGEAVITARIDGNGFTAACTVTVEGGEIAVTGVTLDKTALTLAPDSVAFLTATVEPADAADRTVTWSSSDDRIATVSQSGRVIAVSPGRAAITAQAGEQTADCAVTVLSPTHDEGVVINGVRWATRNVDAPGLFAAAPESPGMYYQWGFGAGWLPDETGWPGITPTDGYTMWPAEDDPSPAGWRLPNTEELNSLCVTSKVTSEWITQNGVTGRKFTDNTTGASIFLPAVGALDWSDGSLGSYGISGNYWSRFPHTELVYHSGHAYFLSVNSSRAAISNVGHKSDGLSVRPVAE